MTLQSRKKHQITALTLRRAIRTSAAFLLASIWLASSPGLALGQTSGGNGSFRPVPKFGSQTQQPARTGGSQPEGWNLQWRQSNRGPQARTAVRSQPSQRIHQAAVAPRSVNVNQVNWQAPAGRNTFGQNAPAQSAPAQSAQGETLIPPPSAAQTKPNYFSNPFGDDPLPAKTPAAEPPANRSRLNPAPAGQGEQLISPPTQPESEVLTPPNGLRSRPNLFETDPAQIEPLREPEPPSSIPSPEETMPEPSFDLPEKDAEPNLGDHLRNELPDAPSRDDAEEDLPAPKKEMDLEDDENPFDDLGRDSDDDQETDRDAEDRDRINSGEDADDSDDAGASVEDDDLKAPSATACADFRERIATQTIDQVSLDISPPYRPDEIDMEKYRELKQDFDEKQAYRDWRSIDGSPLASGRLRDLAYEKAVIESSSGAIEELQLNRLSESDIAFIAENWGLPSECLLDQAAPTPRNWVMTTMTWKASNVCHTPLYFQDVNLERYGHTHGPLLEPLVQSAHFFGNVVVLPYKMGVHSPHECQYPLGYYRPGNCAPWIKQPVPISAKGALTQAVTMTGLFWLIP